MATHYGNANSSGYMILVLNSSLFNLNSPAFTVIELFLLYGADPFLRLHSSMDVSEIVTNLFLPPVAEQLMGYLQRERQARDSRPLPPSVGKASDSTASAREDIFSNPRFDGKRHPNGRYFDPAYLRKSQNAKSRGTFGAIPGRKSTTNSNSTTGIRKAVVKRKVVRDFPPNWAWDLYQTQ
ncbi:hypothetical protein M501DRAFT_1019066 [Patellaria atrata CBS 101060]|uniref:Uncharacterized protein n=1 Tax=Patellaria atrata CBS 101060 TaxID=1346257 RepID=A0A9P4VQ82_9PEZI|nr:hypothetical protein M501DRAFT_1019066 [Patellaria atrata CBS 101060]